MKRTLKIKLDLEKGLQFSEEKIFTQGDLNTHFLNVILPEGLDLENKTMQINFIKPNKEVVYEIIDNLSQENEVKVSNNILDTPGKVYVEIILKKSDVEILTINKLAYFIVTQTIAGTNVEVKIGENTITTITEKLLQLSESLIETNEAIQNAKTAVEDIKQEGIKQINAVIDANQTTKIYGVTFEGSASKGTRTYNAVGMVAEVAIDDEIVRNDFDNVDFFERKVCCGDYDSEGNFHINAYEGDPCFARDGTNGEVWYEQKPFYWNGSYDGFVSVSGTKIEGYELAPLFKNSHDYVYLPCYWLATIGEKATSRSGTFADIGSQISHIEKAKTYNFYGHTETMKAHMTEYILQLVEFATKDLQTIMMGASNMNYSASHTAILEEESTNRIVIGTSQANSYVIGQTICIGSSLGSTNIAKDRLITSIETKDDSTSALVFDGELVDISIGSIVWNRTWKNGATDIVKASSGSIGSNASGKYPCVWRGKVDPWADGYSILSDILIKREGEGTEENSYSYIPYYLDDISKYSNGTITDDYTRLNYSLPVSDGYAEFLGVDERYKEAALTSEIGGNSGNYLSAYYYFPRYDTCVAFVGGHWADGRGCSPVFFSLWTAPSNSSVNRLARLFVSRV